MAVVAKRNITETLAQKPEKLSENFQAHNLAVADSNPAPQPNSQTIQTNQVWGLDVTRK